MEFHSRMDASLEATPGRPEPPRRHQRMEDSARMARMTAPSHFLSGNVGASSRYASTANRGRYGRELREPTARGLNVTSQVLSIARRANPGTPRCGCRDYWFPLAMPRHAM